MAYTYKKIIMTSGISLFAGANTYGEATRKGSWYGFDRSNPISKEIDDAAQTQIQRQWLSAMQEMIRSSEEHPERVSAEYSLLHALQQQNLLDARPLIHLFHTDTLGGELAALLLCTLFEKHFNAEVKRHCLKEINVNDRELLKRALSGFMHQLSIELENSNKETTCFAPIGGYKVMTSFGYIAAAIHGYYSAYLHEDAQILHQIPPVPFAFPEFEKAHHAVLLQLLNSPLEKKSLDEPTKAFLNSLSGVFEQDDTYFDLSALGRYLLERPESGLHKTQFLFSKRALEGVEATPHAKPFILSQLQSLWDKAQQNKQDPNACKGELYHEAVYPGKYPLHLYKGSSNGQLVFRAVWQFNEDRSQILINWIGLSHDVYEKEVKLHLSQKYLPFTALSDSF